MHAGRLEDGAGRAPGTGVIAGGAGFNSTLAASCSPRMTWVIVEPARGTLNRLLRASSIPFWMAAGTSFAFP